MAVTNISERGVTFITQWEGFSSKAYWDANGKVWTCGFGATRGVTKNTTCTRQTAWNWVYRDCVSICRWLAAQKLELTQGQFDALVCFAYNVGIGNLKRSTLIWNVRQGKPVEDITAQFRRWNKSGGKVLTGLAIRREGEAMLYESGKYATYAEAKKRYEDYLKKMGKV